MLPVASESKSRIRVVTGAVDLGRHGGRDSVDHCPLAARPGVLCPSCPVSVLANLSDPVTVINQYFVLLLSFPCHLVLALPD